MSISSKNTYQSLVNSLASLPIFKSLRNGLKLSTHIQRLSSKIDAEALSRVLDELALFSLIGILFQPTPKEAAVETINQGDKSREDSHVEVPLAKPNPEASENVPAQGGEAASS